MVTGNRFVRHGAMMVLVIGFFFSALCFRATADRLAWPASGPVVVLDPGHGGADSGLEGPDGRLEKAAVLDLARTLAAAMAEKFRVVLTRNDDYNMQADQRAGAANKAAAAAFISLHAGNGRYPNRDTITIFVHKPDAFKNDGLCRPGPSASAASWTRNQAPFLADSRNLAETLAASLQEAMPAGIRIAVLRAPVLVLRGVKSPAVMVEVGFLLNPAARQATISVFRQSDFVTAVASGLQRFFSRR